MPVSGVRVAVGLVITKFKFKQLIRSIINQYIVVSGGRQYPSGFLIVYECFC